MLRPAALDGVVCTKVVVAIIEGVAIEHLKNHRTGACVHEEHDKKTRGHVLVASNL